MIFVIYSITDDSQDIIAQYQDATKYTLLAWNDYSDEGINKVGDYIRLGLPVPGTFPSFVDLKSKAIVTDLAALETAVHNAYMTLLRNTRDAKLASSTWIFQRHQNELEMIKLGLITATTLSEEGYKEWLEFWQLLRDLPKVYENNPQDVEFPQEPSKG